MKKILLCILASAVTLSSVPAATIIAAPPTAAESTATNGIEAEPADSDSAGMNSEQTSAFSNSAKAESENTSPVETAKENPDPVEVNQQESAAVEADPENPDPVETNQEAPAPVETDPADSDLIETALKESTLIETAPETAEPEVPEADASNPESIGSFASAENLPEELPSNDIMDADDPAKLASIKLSFSSLVYNGTPRTQSQEKAVVQGMKNGVLTKLAFGDDYTLRYENNTEIGTAFVHALGIGNYTGTVTASFQIIPGRPSVKSVKAGTGKITVYWTGQSGAADGYEAQACRSKKFSSNVKSGTFAGGSAASGTINGLVSGKKYYVRVRTYKLVGNQKYYSKWSTVKSRKLTYNSVSVTGSGKYRTIVLNNPKSNIASAKAAVWSVKNGKDDLKRYIMKKRSDGSWYAKVYAYYLKRIGRVQANVYTNKNTLLKKLNFRFTKAEYQSTKNTIKISGSGSSRTVRVVNPVSGAANLRAAVWSEEGGQDDIIWYPMKKQSDGSWKVRISLNRLLHSGNAFVHIYANTDTFLGGRTFTAPDFGFPVCQTEEEYIARIAPAVVNACSKYGYLPSVLIAQSCLENGYAIPSYWDNPEISALMRYNNMVGMKTSLLNSSWDHVTVWPGESIVKQTPEEYDGVRVTITDSFRVYDSIEQSFEDFLLFLTYASNYGYGGTPKYGQEVLAIKNPEKLIRTVAGRGYATDSSYAKSVMRIINKHNLTQYDP